MSIESWKLKEWSNFYLSAKKMTDEEIEEAIKFLRNNNYPKPVDCPGKECPAGFRPACRLGICKVAVMLCGDW